MAIESINQTPFYSFRKDLALSNEVFQKQNKEYFKKALTEGMNISRGISSAGRAFGWQPKGQRFDPAMLHT